MYSKIRALLSGLEAIGVKEELCFLLNTFLYFPQNLSICLSPFFIVPYFYN